MRPPVGRCIMTYQAVRWAFSQATGLGKKVPSATLVLAALADRVLPRDVDQCWPKLEELAEMTGLGKATIMRQIAALEELGLVTRSRRYRDDGYRAPNRYRLNMQRDELTSHDEETDLSSQDEKRERFSLPIHDGLTSHRRPISLPAVSTQEQREEQREEQVKQEHPAARDAFAEFWAIYPVHVKEQEAREAFATAIKHTPAETIIAGAVIYAGSQRVADGYVTHPPRWLRGKQWTDEPEPARAGRDRPTREQDAASILATVEDLLPTAHPAPLALPGGSA